jgi:hypothetical protein
MGEAAASEGLDQRLVGHVEVARRIEERVAQGSGRDVWRLRHEGEGGVLGRRMRPDPHGQSPAIARIRVLFPVPDSP